MDGFTHTKQLLNLLCIVYYIVFVVVLLRNVSAVRTLSLAYREFKIEIFHVHIFEDSTCLLNPQ